MILKVKIFLFLFLSFSLGLYSQTIIKRDTLSGTELIVEMDEQVDKAFASIEDKCDVLKANNGGNVPKKTPTRQNTIRTKTVTRSEICRRNPKMLGYKVLVGIRKNNRDANELKGQFRQRFPRIRTITDASLRPNYKILAGSYLSRESASSDLRKIRRAFSSATLVQHQIYCVEAK